MLKRNMESSTNHEFNPNVTFAFDFEKRFNVLTSTRILGDYIYLPYVLAAVYLVFVFTGKEFMKTREAFQLRTPLIMWNVALCVFSAIGTVRVIPQLFQAILNEGIQYSICDRGDFYDNRVISCWFYLFTISKVIELFDTAFIVTRKGHLSFLHWFHHAATLIVTWHGFVELISQCRIYTGMNFAIHTLMYGYYALKAAQIRVPRGIAMFITVCQITQMIIGMVVSVTSWVTLLRGDSCHVSSELSFALVCIYTVYFYLFTKFFMASYFNTGSEKSKGKFKKE